MHPHPRHLRPSHRHRRMRHSLQRRLFVWFGVTILCTGLAVGAVFSLLGPWRSHVGGELDTARELVESQFALVWEDAAARHALAARISRLLGADLTLEDDRGAVIDTLGPPCERSAYEVRISTGKGPVGLVRGCPRRHPPHPWVFLSALLAAAGTVWLAAAAVSVRLGRPLAELVRVTREIGAGKLTARVRLGRYQLGEVGALADSVNDMASRIEAELRSQRELLAAVSHEIRSPLARLRLLVELARSEKDGDRALSEIDAEIVQIDDLVGKLLASSRLDFEALTLKPVVARDAAERVLSAAHEPPDRLRDGSAGAIVDADATLLGRALANLVENARSHGRGLDALALRLEPVSGVPHVVFEVQDRGPGFPAADLPRVFEPFFRSGDRGHGALGLGLSLVDRIAKAHGGSAFAQNRPGGGAVTGLRIPVRPA